KHIREKMKLELINLQNEEATDLQSKLALASQENEFEKITDDAKSNRRLQKVEKEDKAKNFESHLELKKGENSSIQYFSLPEENEPGKITDDYIKPDRHLQRVEKEDKAENFKILKQPLPLIWEGKCKSINGIIIGKYSIEQSIDPVMVYKYSPKLIIEYKKSKNMKISYASKIRDSFMLSEGIEIDESSSEDLKNFLMLFDMNLSKYSDNAFLNDLETHDVYFEITSEQVTIAYDIQNINVTGELKFSVEKALKSNTPIEDLKHVFNKFGHLFTTKLIIGNKLQRIVRLNGENNDKENKRSIYLPEFNELDNETLNRWKKEIQPHDSSYLLTMDGGSIEINKISKWLENIPLFETEWLIIKRVVIPLYKILAIDQKQKIEKLFSKQDHILMTNTTTILDFDTGYQRIDFNSKLKSSSYQIFGKVVDANGQTFSNIYVKFSLESEYGFSVNWIQAGDSLQTPPYNLEWMLIGCPSEIGYFDSTTRDKEIKTGSTELKIASRKEATILKDEDLTQQWSCRINLDRSLSPSSVVSLNVEYPTTRKTPILKASYQILPESHSNIEIKVEPIKDEYVEFLSEDEEITVAVRWCVVFEGSMTRDWSLIFSKTIILNTQPQHFYGK
ncbi:9682_t:CDS:2, partial [Ambispora gerdemannii]